MNRRQFLRLMGMAGAAAAIPWRFDLQQGLVGARAYAFSQSPTLRKFVQALPGLTPAGANEVGQYLTVLTPDTLSFPGSDYYQVVASQFKQQIHPDLPATTFWGYAQDGANPDKKYLGGVIVANKDRPVRLTMRNALPPNHILPVDKSLTMWNGMPGQATGVNRMSTHLHGGFPPWISDGTPFQDFDPNGGYGFSAAQPPDMPAPPAGSYNYYWTNQQRAKFMWYHDHAMDITRLNAYAGLATGYVLTDPFEASVAAKGILPPASRTIYMVLQEKTFRADGSLWYPSAYQWFGFGTPGSKARWPWGGDPVAMAPAPVAKGVVAPPSVSLVPEAFFDTILVNGAAFPYCDVQPRHYRFRILNGSQARFYNLQLYYAQSNDLANPLSGEADFTKPGPQFIQIGNEGGFLPTPVALPSAPAAPGVTQQQIGFDTNPVSPTFGNANAYTLLLAPAERCDLIIDFSQVPAGSKLMLYSDAPAPFPSGDPLNDYFTGDPDQTASGGAAATLLGKGPNTRTLMQFRVGSLVGVADGPNQSIPQNVALGLQQKVIFQPVLPLPQNKAQVRRLTLNEDFDYWGRLIQRLGTVKQNGVNNQGLPTWGRNYQTNATETPKAGALEIWEIYNLTGDTHPIHFHLVNVQVLARQPFDAGNFNGTPVFTGPARPPDANEAGWKETVRMNPNEMTRVIMKFDLPTLPFAVPLSTRLSDPTKPAGPNNQPINGYEYVWHCHILEHEEHDMMRPLVVIP